MKILVQNFSILIFSLMLAVSIAHALAIDESKIHKELPMLLGSSNQGKEFFLTFHPCWETSGKNNVLKIYITSAVATLVTVEIPRKNIHLQKTTIPNGVIEFSFDPAQGQCYRKSDRDAPQPQRVYKACGIIVTAEDPIVCYGVTRYIATSDGYLAIPKNALGMNYVVSSYNDPCEDNGKQYLTSYTSIVAAYNQTEVKVRIGGRASNYTPGLNSMRTGDVRTEILDRGDVWLIGAQGDYNDLTGTNVDANKPVSVISGNFCANVPIKVGACDFLIEQNLPIGAWGYKYHVTPIINRRKGSIIRVLSSEPNTMIYRDGNEWSLVKTAGGTEGIGFIEGRTVDDTEKPRPVTISAQNRIAVTQYNSSKYDDDMESDPFQLSLIPTEQYQTNFLWCTPGLKDGLFFKQNYLNLCYKSTESGKIPDDIEFGKVSNGVITWRKLSSVVSNPGEAFVDKEITDLCKYHSLTIKLEDPTGVYSIRGRDGMAAYGYGFDFADSYGFPVSAGLSDLAKPDIWAPVPTYEIDCIGQVEGRVIEQPEKDDSLRSNMADLNLIKSETYNFSDLIYDKESFISGVSNIVDWSLSVINIEDDAKAVLAFIDRAGNDTTITMQYQRTRFSIKNEFENWGMKAYNDPPETRNFILINESEKPLAVDSIFLLSNDKKRSLPHNGFTVDQSIYKEHGGVLPGYTMQPGEELKFKVIFDPHSIIDNYLTGKIQFLDSIGVKAYCSNKIKNHCYYKYKAAVQSAVGSPCISVDRIDFGRATINIPITKSFTIYNRGTSELRITGYKLLNGNSKTIYISNIGDISVSNPLRISPGGAGHYTVTFKPDELKQFPDQIIFESDAIKTCTDYDSILELTGEGMNPGL